MADPSAGVVFDIFQLAVKSVPKIAKCQPTFLTLSPE